jgi:putative DNA primase/helicase
VDIHAIARALGGEVSGGQVLCPGPGHGPRDRSLTVKLSASSPDGFIVFSHSGDDWKICHDYVRKRLGIPSRKDRRQRPSIIGKPAIAADPPKALPGLSQSDDDAKRDLVSAAQYVSEMRPLITEPLAVAYFGDLRKIDTGAIGDVLERTDVIGWHPSVYFNQPGHPLHGQRLGAILAVMTDAITAEPTGAISRTYLAPDGTKVAKAKTLGAPTGIVRLSRDDDVLGGLFIAEGLETALTAMALGLRPIWATGSSGLMAKFPLLDGVQAVNVIADHDRGGAGERAAREVEARWRAAGREVNLFRSDAPGDLNDALKGIGQ